MLGRWLVGHVRVRDEQAALRGDQQVNGRKIRNPRGHADDVAHVIQVPVEAAVDTADHAVDIAAVKQQGCQGRGSGQDDRARIGRGYALAFHDAVIVVAIPFVIRIVGRIENVEVLAADYMQTHVADRCLDQLPAPE